MYQILACQMKITMTTLFEWISIVKIAEKQSSEKKSAEHLTKLFRENLDKTNKCLWLICFRGICSASIGFKIGHDQKVRDFWLYEWESHDKQCQSDHNFIICKRTKLPLSIRWSATAKPIELGLVLDREESIKFQKYIDNPTYTEEGRKLIREAADLAERSRF